MLQVAVIFGVMGACRRQELHTLLYENVQDLNGTLLVQIMNTKTKINRTFTVTGKFYDITKKYLNLRPELSTNVNFFIKYYKGKCMSQNVGINTFGNMGKIMASYLKLPNPELYTGHCFRRTSATLLIDAGGDITALKRHGGWKSTSVAETYIDNSIQSKIKVSKIILNSIEQTSNSTDQDQPKLSAPSTSNQLNDGLWDYTETSHSPTFTPSGFMPASPTFTPKQFDDFNFSQTLKHHLNNAPLIMSNNNIEHFHVHFHK